jgi:hypothetical protein
MFERRLERVRKVDKDDFWNDRKIFEKIGFCIFGVFCFSQPSMASYSFSSPGYVNIPPYYNTTPNGYSALNFQYPLPESKFLKFLFFFNKFLFFYL